MTSGPSDEDVENLAPVPDGEPFAEPGPQPKRRAPRKKKEPDPVPELSFSAVDVAEYLWKLNDEDEFCSERFEGDPHFRYTVNVGIGPLPGSLEIESNAWSKESGEAHEPSTKKFVMFIRELV